MPTADWLLVFGFVPGDLFLHRRLCIDSFHQTDNIWIGFNRELSGPQGSWRCSGSDPPTTRNAIRSTEIALKSRIR